MLLDDHLSEAARRHALELIDRNAQAQAQLVNDLVDMSRMTTGKLQIELEPLPLVPVAGERRSKACGRQPQAKDITIDTDWHVDDVNVLADATRLQQVLWNLLSNAVKFTPAGGRISVERRRDRRPRPHRGRRIPASASTPAFLPHVFDRFRQADSATTRRHGGLGLGLAIVHDLVRLHGGDVEVSSAGVGKGATFVVTLRASDGEVRAPDRRNRWPRAVSLNGQSVVLLEDHDDSRDLLVQALRSSGAAVAAFATAPDAFEALDPRPPVGDRRRHRAAGRGWLLVHQARPRPFDDRDPVGAGHRGDGLRHERGSRRGAGGRLPAAPGQADRSRAAGARDLRLDAPLGVALARRACGRVVHPLRCRVPYRIDLAGVAADAFDRLVDLGAIDAETAGARGIAALMPDDVTPAQIAGALGVSADDIVVSPAAARDAGSTWILSPRPIAAGRLRILPAHFAAEPRSLRLIDTAAFGTGLHPTTALCLEALDEEVSAVLPDAVLDVGTGFGNSRARRADARRPARVRRRHRRRRAADRSRERHRQRPRRPAGADTRRP